MADDDRSGLITGTREEIARVCRCTAVELDQALAELGTTKTADVTFRNKIVTVVNRRMNREYKVRKCIALRVAKYRVKVACNAPETGEMLDVRDQRLDTKYTHTPRAGSKLIPKNLEEVKAWAAMDGVSLETAERFYNHYEGSGWIDKNGNPVINARAKLKTWAEGDRAKPIEQAHKDREGPARAEPKNDFWRTSKELDLVNAEIQAIENRASRTAMDTIINPADLAQYNRLRKKRKELKQGLGI